MTTNSDSGIILNVLRTIGEHLQILLAKPPKKLNTVDVASFAKARIEEDKRVMEKAIEQGYNPHLVKSSKVQNELYKGDNYTVKFNEYEVTITNESKQYTRKINLSNVLAGMNEKDKIEFLKKIQTLPAEVLDDMSVEVDRLASTTGQNMNTISTNPDFVAGGCYRGNKDTITTKPKHIVHELAHAIDYQGVNNMDGKNNHSRILQNKKFLKAFQMGLDRYIKKGNKQYDYNDKTTWSNKLSNFKKESNYCTANPKELWAELYTALMTGTCQSYNTIVKFFPEAIIVGKELLAEFRSENPETRHNTQMRQALSAINSLV